VIWSVSADLDGLGCYAAIHGLRLALGDRAQRAVPEVAVQRLCEAFENVKGTFFVIGSEASIAPQALRGAAAAGHEIGSHSFAHDYAMSRWQGPEIARDLERADLAIEEATGVKPRGFRAPGYTLSPALLDEVRARGYVYDSSLLPSPPYYAAKAAVMAARLGRSASVLGGVGQLFARRGPHLRRGVRELPIATLPLIRAPLIGTVVLGVGDALAARLSRWAFPGGHFNLELHGIDALDASDVPADIAAVQPGLRVAASEKLRRLRSLLRSLRERGESCTLEQAALRLLPSPS
jgi:hypothetical protein